MDAVRSFVAVQSQDYPGATWALAQRSGGPPQAAIDAAFDDGAFIRTHVLRPTWHFVAPEDLRWLLALTGQRLIRGAAHRHRALGIDSALIARAARVFERAIAEEGPQTRPELGAALGRVGIEADAGRLMHLIMWAEYSALLCSGPRKGKLQSYALLEQRIAPARPRERDEALAELAGRYVAGHGPVQDIDLAWWSGLSLGDARRGLSGAGDRVERTVLDDGRTFWSADGGSSSGSGGGNAAGDRTIHLLPNYDEMLVALRDRADGLDPELPAWARTAEEIFSYVILRRGRVIGQWTRSTGSGPLRLTMEPRVPLDAGDRDGIVAEAERFAAFTGRPAQVTGLD